MSPLKGHRKAVDKLRCVRKSKSNANMPVNLKISIPLQGSEREGIHVPIIKGRRPPQYTKHLDKETKVDLANLVAKQQLVKEEPPVFHNDNVVIIHTPKPRGRKKKDKVVSDFFQNYIVLGNNTAEDATDTKLPEKKSPGKKSTAIKKPVPPRKILTRKRLADSKAEEDAKRLKVEVKTDTEDCDANILEDKAFALDTTDKTDSDNFVEPLSIPVVVQPTSPIKSKSPVKRLQSTGKKPWPKRQPSTGGKTRSKGKQQSVQTSIETPSSVDTLKNNVTEAAVKTKQNQKNAPGSVVSRKNSVGSSSMLLKNKVKDAAVKTKQNQQNSPGLVVSRKSSVGSISNKSWTRDISSSSATTCIGSVCSNDFVRIDNKLPVLKLTTIDSEVKRRQNAAKEITASATVDETDEDLSDSYDSDSSDSEMKFSEQLNDSLGANSLHLSASSSSQFTQSRRKESTSDCPKGNSSDYTKAANKLSLTMEKLDLEIIKWMNSENENINANHVKFRDKMFDILDREFGVITHCRHLKEMLDPPLKGGSINESCNSKQVVDCDANTDIENVLLVEKAQVVEKAPVKEHTPVDKNTREVVKEFVEPRRRPSRHLSNTSEGNISNASSRASKEVTSDNEMAAGTSYPYYDHHDDDDTLSLFAESISGFESARINTSNASVVVSKSHQVEEYIPKPVTEDYVPSTEKQTYCPTKIREDDAMIASKIINICEKQNADSTSIYKKSISTDDAESNQDFMENVDLADARLNPPDMIKKPRLMDSYFEGLPKARSVVFGSVCFYNLLNTCRKGFFGQCRYVHLVPTSEQIQEKLKLLDERQLIQEYLLLRNWNDLRRKYGMCYVEECAKRRLTRILVEIAYDFIEKARNDSEEDRQLRVRTIEATLLHLNTVDLSICEDLLTLTIRSDKVNRTLLCDVLMATMSIMQNFARFKIAFLNLTYFMVDNDRRFVEDVVEHILERVCILPFDEPIARALIQMIRLTKSDIFKNSMIGHFEKQISVNKDVFEEYTLLKTQCAFSSMLSSVVSASPPTQVPQGRPDGLNQLPPAASPDTTNMDFIMNKATEAPSEPVITRTIGTNPAIIFNQAALSSDGSRVRTSPGHSNSFVNPGSCQSYVNPDPSSPHVNNTELHKSDDSVQQNIRKWRNRSIFPHIIPPLMATRAPMRGTPTRGSYARGAMRPPMRPPMRPQMRPPPRSPFTQRQVTFKEPSVCIPGFITPAG